MENLTIGHDRLGYSVMTGTVQHIDSRTETKVSGSGGGGTSFYGTGATSSMYISSRSILHQTIYLIDGEGNNFSVALEDFNVSSIKGQELVFVWSESLYNKGYAAVYNKTLDMIYYGKLRSFFKPINGEEGSAIIKIGAIAVLAISALGYGTTKSNLIGFFSFVISVVLIGLYYNKFKTGQKSGNKNAISLRGRLNGIIQDFLKNNSQLVKAV